MLTKMYISSKKLRNRRFFGSFIFVAFAVLGSPIAGAAEEKERSLTVLAAASMTDVVESLAERYREKTGCQVATNFAASSTLAHQILAGANADLYISAGEEWADFLEKKNRVALRQRPIKTQLVVIVPKTSKLSLGSLNELLQEDVKQIAIADPSGVPAGLRAKEALEYCSIYDTIQPRLVAAKDVRAALRYVETKAVEAGIVYASDAKANESVRVVFEIPPEFTNPITYNFIKLRSAKNAAIADDFLQFLGTPEIQKEFEKFGFVACHSPVSYVPDGVANSTAPALHRDWSPVYLSLLFATLAASLGLIPAIFLALWLAREERGIFHWLIDTSVNLPLVLPPVVTGYFLLYLLSPSGPICEIAVHWFDLKLIFTPVAAVIAAGVVSFPLLVRPIRLAFSEIDPRMAGVARTLGASRIRTFFSVTLPLSRRGLIAGWVLAFARSLGEFGATIMVAGNIVGKTQTIPLAIYSHTHSAEGLESSLPLILVAVFISCLALTLGSFLERGRVRNAA